ncbi:hypothetical protein NPIL_446231, partial [Nephila pilipes]
QFSFSFQLAPNPDVSPVAKSITSPCDGALTRVHEDGSAMRLLCVPAGAGCAGPRSAKRGSPKNPYSTRIFTVTGVPLPWGG